MSLAPEPVLFAQAFLQQFAPDTAIENVPVRVMRLEQDDMPPALLLEPAGEVHERSLPVFLPARVAVVAYALSADAALLLYRTASDLFHRTGPVLIDGIGLFKAFDETGPQPRDEPNTTWHGVFGVIALYMADQAIQSGS